MVDRDGPIYIIGVGRSGTTLLRLMLDGHPRVAVGGETPWVTSVAPMARHLSVGELLEAILAHPRYPAWGLDAAKARAAVAENAPATWPELVATLFSAYARERGKPRWGDKTPTHIGHVRSLARWFPSARFVHIIRDGREVAVSLAEQPWGSRNATAAAFYWRRAVRSTRRYGARLGPGRYHEVRLEDLVRDPVDALHGVCDFLGERFEETMLDYPERMRARAGSLERAHVSLTLPPTPGLRNWRVGLSPLQQRAVGSVCRTTLRGLGYPAPRPSLSGWALARLDRSKGAALRLVRR